MPYEHPRCRLVPLPDDRVAFEVDGVERTRWHFGTNAPRPFFHPVVGPSGTNLVRMGHPGAANHDHHRGAWFAHAKVSGVDFWSDRTDARIRQRFWLSYVDGDDEAIMAARLRWYDGHDPAELLEQELVAAVRPGEGDDWFLELQTSLVPKSEMLELQQTNFGLLAVRMAKHVSAFFGDGVITDSAGRVQEPAIFGRAAAWMDYSGPVPGSDGREGITYFSLPRNPGAPGFPPKWHVREDGWMGASVCRDGSLVTTQADPLVFRYLLHVHDGPVDAKRAERVAAEFAARPGFVVEKSAARHRQYVARRVDG